MTVQAGRFTDYDKAFFREADGVDTDVDALISQCDNDTRIAVYKASAEIVVFVVRIGVRNDKSWLDDGSLFLYRLMLVLEKSNLQDGDLATLDERLKAAYVRAHLSISQNLLSVDSYVRAIAPAASRTHYSCATPDVEATVTDPVQPRYPQSARNLGLGAVTVEVQVSVGPTGNVVGASVYRSSSNIAIDEAALQAARESKYSPARKNCQPTTGDFLFRADFQPDP